VSVSVLSGPALAGEALDRAARVRLPRRAALQCLRGGQLHRRGL